MTIPAAPVPGPARRVDGGLPSAVELRQQLLDGTLTAQELLARCLERIDALNPELGAFVALDREGAAAAAKEADAVLAKHREDGSPVPPLTGLPMAFKDLIDVAGLPTTHGTAAFPAAMRSADNPLVARVRAAGAVLVGKTAVPEFGLSCHSENLIHPPSRNPLDPSTSSGGSSGGAAASVAAGMVPISPGSDGGGSVRIPASACGIVGLKPGLGAIPEDLLGLDGSSTPTDRWGAQRLAVSGPLGRDAADAALMWDGMTFDAAVPGATPALDAVQAALRGGTAFEGLRVGFTTRSAFDENLHPVVGPEALAAFQRGVQLAQDLGAKTEQAEWTLPEDIAAAFRAVWTSGLAEGEMSQEQLEAIGALARDFRAEALARPADVQRAQSLRLQEIGAGLRQDWAAYDVVMTPAMAQTPRPIGWYTSQDAQTDYDLQCLYTPFTSMVNIAGLPAIAVPVFWTSEGHSMSVQLIGRSGSEVQLLQLAALLQRAAA